MDRKLHLLETFVAQDEHGAPYKVFGYEHLVKMPSAPELPQHWEPTRHRRVQAGWWRACRSATRRYLVHRQDRVAAASAVMASRVHLTLIEPFAQIRAATNSKRGDALFRTPRCSEGCGSRTPSRLGSWRFGKIGLFAASRIRRVAPTLAPSDHCSDNSWFRPTDKAALMTPRARGEDRRARRGRLRRRHAVVGLRVIAIGDDSRCIDEAVQLAEQRKAHRRAHRQEAARWRAWSRRCRPRRRE